MKILVARIIFSVFIIVLGTLTGYRLFTFVPSQPSANHINLPVERNLNESESCSSSLLLHSIKKSRNFLTQDRKLLLRLINRTAHPDQELIALMIGSHRSQELLLCKEVERVVMHVFQPVGSSGRWFDYQFSKSCSDSFNRNTTQNNILSPPSTPRDTQLLLHDSTPVDIINVFGEWHHVDTLRELERKLTFAPADLLLWEYGYAGETSVNNTLLSTVSWLEDLGYTSYALAHNKLAPISGVCAHTVANLAGKVLIAFNIISISERSPYGHLPGKYVVDQRETFRAVESTLYPSRRAFAS